MSKAPAIRYQGPLVANHASKPMERLYVDLQGPFIRSSEGYNNILIVLDDVTKYVFLIPLRNATSKSVNRALLDVVFKNFSFPQIIVCDQGPAFRSKEFSDFLFRVGINWRQLITFMPQTNRSERQLKRVRAMLCAYFHDKQRLWSTELAHLQLALNSSVSDATGFSPHRLMFGFEFRDPLINVWKLEDLLDENVSSEEQAIKIEQAIKNLKKSVVENQKRHKYSFKFANHPYKVGDIVYVRTHVLSNKDKGVQSKLSLLYKGPYKILLISNRVTVTLQSVQNELEVIKAHVSQLKK